MKKIKSLIAVILSVACFFSLFSMSAGAASSNFIGDYPYSFVFDKTGNRVGDTAEFFAYWPPEANIKWKVSDSSIAKLELQTETCSQGGYASGQITFLQAGTFKLKGVDKKTGEVIYKKTITVKPYEKGSSKKNEYEDYTIDWPCKTIYAGDYIQFYYYYSPDTQIKWFASDFSKITILPVQSDSKTAKSWGYGHDLISLGFNQAGTVSIKAVDSTTGKTVVKKEFDVQTAVDKIAFKDGSSYTMNKGDTAILKYTYQNTKGQKVSATKIPERLAFRAATSDKNVVKIKSQKNGKIKIHAVGSGTAKIKVKSYDGSGKTATIKITVK